ncbi:MAG: hypothetical protein L0H96_12730 [Humibacillus sp.]|nr:hypothetical protein [Humibacillus sp.]MDN5777770.1 hypothetical protein [Humibacillus sp.]
MKINTAMRAAAVAAAVGGVLTVASPASVALPGSFGALVPSTFVTQYNTVDLPTEGVGSGSVACPSGMALVSAGGLAAGLSSITPSPGYTGTTVTGRAERGTSLRIVVAEATCAPVSQFAGTTIATGRDQRAHSDLGEWTQTISCPAGMRAFGGGGYFKTSTGAVSKDGYNLSANSVTLNGRGWTVSAVNHTFSDALVVTTRCAPQSSSTRLVEEIYPITPQRGASSGSANGYAHCPAGHLPISGGAQITQDGTAEPSGSILSDSVLVENGQLGWHASGSSGGEHAELHVVALCGS